MAKILYGVAGQGFGHSSRSHLIGKHLLERGHDVIFAGSMKSYSYLKDVFGPERVREVMGLRLIYDNGKLATLRTGIQNLKCYPAGRKTNRSLFTEMRDFKPDLVISDYEPFSAWWAWRREIPCITIDHQSTMTQCILDKIPGVGPGGLAARVLTCVYYPGCDRHIAVNFFKAALRSERAVLAGPVIREEVLARSPSQGDKVIFYTTDVSFKEKLGEIFGRFTNTQFLIYGYNEDRQQGNCTFKKTSTEGFLEDLSKCRGVIATAGFSLICECLHFRKKMLLLPIRGQYEQVINAHYMQKLGMGINCMEGLNANVVEAFLNGLDDPAQGAEMILYPDNEKFHAILDRVITDVIG